MSAESYLKDTMTAVKGLFALLDYYDHLTYPPSLIQFYDDNGLATMNRFQSEDYLLAYNESLAFDFSKATLSGSILQVAHKALEEFSTNTKFPSTAFKLGVSAKTKLIRYAVGREVQGIPAGLLIYAGRIQYNHFEEGWQINNVARSVFEALLQHYIDYLSFDMAYELEWPVPRPVSHYLVRHELKWFKISEYEADMRNMLEMS